jgi:hypothetical protein
VTANGHVTCGLFHAGCSHSGCEAKKGVTETEGRKSDCKWACDAWSVSCRAHIVVTRLGRVQP